MLHPVIKLIASRPDLLAAHAAGYAELAAAEAGEAVVAFRQRVLLTAGALLMAGVACGLGGMALLLLAAVPMDGMPAPWALAAVPLLAALMAAALAWLAGRTAGAMSFDALKAQWTLDARLLAEATRS